MAKSCPLNGGKKVLYLECLECENRVCKDRVVEKPQATILPKKEKGANSVDVEKKVVSEHIQEPQNTSREDKTIHSDCETCCHKCGEHKTTMFGRTFQAIQCKIFHNRVFTSGMVKEKGCEYHNRDISNDKICLNCEYYLGGGDWGLACSADYYKLPESTSEACEKFKRKEERDDA